MAISYTDMARMLAPRRPGIRPPTGLSGDIPEPDLSSPEAAEAWMLSLPADVRKHLQDTLTAVAMSLPVNVQIALGQAIRSAGHASPIALPLDGLGCTCDTGQAGLGQDWGSLITGLVKAGTDIYSSQMQVDLQKSLAAKSAATDAAIAKAQIAAQQAIAIANAQASGGTHKSALMWGGISLTLVLGIGAIYLIRRKKK